MLRTSFLHIPGVGTRTEQRLWASGCVNWSSCRENSDLIRAGIRRTVLRWLDDSCRALERQDACFFAELLPANQLWRIYPEFRHKCLFFDIETTGLGSPDDYVTTIATFDGRRIRTFVYGENLDEFPDYLATFPLIVSYNGKCFDVPFLQRHFGGLGSRAAHIDLRYVLAGLGYRGGLKACEQAMGLVRPKELQEVDGFMAVLLWQEHLNGTPHALESLLCYNVYDAINLRWLLQRAYNLAVAEMPLEGEPLDIEPDPTVKFRPDGRLIRSLL